MLTQKHLALTRAEPHGNGGLQFLYRINNYGISAVSLPREEVSQIYWEVDVIVYDDDKTFRYQLCKDTELADKTLVFHNDKSLNEFLEKAFIWFQEVNTLENMMGK